MTEESVIQRELEGVALGSPAVALENDPAWKELGPGMRGLLYSGLRGERIFESFVLDRTVYCGVVADKVYKIGVIVPLAYGASLFAAFSRAYGTPRSGPGGRNTWDDGGTRLEMWTDAAYGQATVFLTDRQLLVRAYGPKPGLWMLLAFAKCFLLNYPLAALARILMPLPFPLLDRIRPRMSPESWATCAVDQLLSAKWESSREQLYDEMRERFPTLSSVPKQSFLAAILAAQMQVLAFVSVKIGPKDLGLAVTLEDFERRRNLPLVDAAYTHCNRKLAQYGIRGVSGFKAIADACVELLGATGSPEFSGWLEAKFEALGHFWRKDIRRHRFLKLGGPG